MTALSGETGRLFESSRLLSDEQAKKLNQLKHHYEKVTDVPYLPYEEALQECIRHNPLVTPEEMADPKSKWLNDLHAELAIALDLEDWDRLRVIPTLGTALDVYHRTDLVICCEDPSEFNEVVVVTVDLTVAPKTKDLTKRGLDVLITDRQAIPTRRYTGIVKASKPVPDIYKATPAEERERNDRLRKNIAHVIKEIIEFKSAMHDVGYRRKKTREAIEELYRSKKKEAH